MQSRLGNRLLALVAMVVVGIVGFLPASPAVASTDTPPFEIFFPQEISATEFTSSFGDGRSGGRSHKGNDLLAVRMTEIYAIADGTVFYVGTNNLSGRNLKIDHGDGWESYYLHLNNDNIGTDDGDAPWTLTLAPGVEEGTPVQAGQLIAWVGDSGNAEGTTPHTHFELHSDGTAIDPYSLLTDAYERAGRLAEALEAGLVLPDLPDYEIE
jgi:murein DD-endopeptidase MepM/ murein hydrolase activator NlpD